MPRVEEGMSLTVMRRCWGTLMRSLMKMMMMMLMMLMMMTSRQPSGLEVRTGQKAGEPLALGLLGVGI